MGIPGFSTWLRQRYPEAFEDPKGPQKHDAVYIDLASTLHTVTRKAFSRSGFHKLLHKRLDELVRSLGAQKRVVIAMDGPAPLAKLLEQRRRRKKEADRTMDNEENSDGDGDIIEGGKEEEGEMGDSYGEVEVSDVAVYGHKAGKHKSRTSWKRKMKESPNRVSSLFLTTGTLFMLEVHNSLKCYILDRLTDPKFAHLEFEFSDSTVKGEGELKIISRLIHTSDPKESHAVVGADSDLLLMTMIACKPNVFVVDDLPKRKTQGPKQKRHQRVFKSDALKSIWKNSLPEGDPGREDISSIARDLTLIAVLCSGNDYLPGCQGLSLKDHTRPGLWNLYLDMRRQPEWFGQSLTKLVPVVRKEYGSHKKKKIKSLGLPEVKVQVNAAMLAALLQRHMLQKYSSSSSKKKFSNISGNWSFGMESINKKKAVAAQASLQTPPILMRLPPDSASYVKGLEWTLTMYTTGGVEDYRYSYPAASPTVMNLVSYLEQKAAVQNSESEVDNSSQEQGLLSFKERAALQPLLPAACALALLPARSRMQAATALRHLMDADSPVAEIYAVCKECQHLARSIREANAQLEEVRTQLSKLQDKLSSVGLDSETALEADSDLADALERWEAAGDPLRDLLRDLSRSHHKHVMESHPYKPFPTEDLEDAVLSVPTNKYPLWERQLTKFGREIVFSAKSDATPELQPSDDEEEDPQWLKECIRFANAYPKIVKADVLRQNATRVDRQVLPLHPYMQPGGAVRVPPRRAFGTHVGLMPAAPLHRPMFSKLDRKVTSPLSTSIASGLPMHVARASRGSMAASRSGMFVQYAKTIVPKLPWLRKIITL